MRGYQSRPDRLLGPVYQSPSHDYSILSDAAAENRITTIAYGDDPLLRTSQVFPPDHTPSNAIRTAYGFWSHEVGLAHAFRTVTDEKGVATTSRIDPWGRVCYTLTDAGRTDRGTRNNLIIHTRDVLDRLTASTLPGRGRSTYAYDTLGRMTSRHHPDADAAMLYKYDDLKRSLLAGRAPACHRHGQGYLHRLRRLRALNPRGRGRGHLLQPRSREVLPLRVGCLQLAQPHDLRRRRPGKRGQLRPGAPD
ncbi:MAG: RHS repeat protein [Gemmatimonadetes bacterium]|nr:RHS repeat protein [Gemmatimonadota bacterium]MYG14995.1 RHS repeat protein [Gemmatimonadota bacterium]